MSDLYSPTFIRLYPTLESEGLVKSRVTQGPRVHPLKIKPFKLDYLKILIKSNHLVGPLDSSLKKPDSTFKDDVHLLSLAILMKAYSKNVNIHIYY